MILRSVSTTAVTALVLGACAHHNASGSEMGTTEQTEPRERSSGAMPQPTHVPIGSSQRAPRVDPDTAADLAKIESARSAIALYEQFLDRAGEDQRFQTAVQRSKERVDDLRAEIAFLEQGIIERRRAEPVGH